MSDPAKVPSQISNAPWTQQQCDKLNQLQHSCKFHPYTCGNDSRHRVLLATPQGWLCQDCDYRQGWAHEISLRILDIMNGIDEPQP